MKMLSIQILLIYFLFATNSCDLNPQFQEAITKFMFKITYFGNTDSILSSTCYKRLLGMKDFQLIEMFHKMGKTFNNESEIECNSNKGQLLTLDFRANPDRFSNYEKLRRILRFVAPLRFFLRICVPQTCFEIVKQAFDRGNNQNQKLFDYFSLKGVSRMRLIDNEELVLAQQDRLRVVCYFLIFLLILYLLLIFYSFISQIILGLIGQAEISSLENEYPNESINESSINMTQIERMQIRQEAPRSVCKNWIKGLSQYFSLFSALRNMFVEEIYYSQKNLNFIALVRFLSLFFITFFAVVKTMMKLPEITGSSRVNGWSNFLLCMTKLSSFWLHVYISLEGLYFAYRLMSFMTKYKMKFEYTFKLYLLFTFKIATRLFSFTFVFIVAILGIREISYMLGSSNFMLYNLKTDYESKLCYRKPSLILIPFYLQYCKHDETSQYNNSKLNEYASLSNCFVTVHIIHNLIYSFVVFNTLFYILLKIRSKILDILVFIGFFSINPISFVKSFLTRSSITSQLSLKTILGERDTFVISHLFMSMYFSGIIVGLTVFYHNDIPENPMQYTSLNKMNNQLNQEMHEDYIPFVFIFKFMRYLKSKGAWIWYTLIGISMTIILLTSISFLIFYDSKGDLRVSESMAVFTFFFDKKIFTVAILTLILIFYLFNSTLITSAILDNKIFIIFERLSFNYFLILDSVTSLFFSLLIANYSIKVIIVYYFTISVVMINTSLAFILTSSLELPFRIFTKRSTDLSLRNTNSVNG